MILFASDNPPDTMKIFTYGTLRVGEGNAGILAGNANYTETAQTVEKYIMVDDSSHCYPYLISCQTWPEMSDKAVYVVGDVYDATSAEIWRSDKLEGHSFVYVRTPVRVVNKHGETYEAEAYILSDTSAKALIQMEVTFLNGDWKANNKRTRYD
jgi:gamma-glutamylcyclotransferase (GGCT)/AIG2-like uncharacterized protein YtfP